MNHTDGVLLAAAIVLIVLCMIAFVIWALNAMFTYDCPTCRREHDEQGVLIPVIPGLRWWCAACSELTSHQQLLEANGIAGTDDAEDE